jgi:hypothetical protein
MTEKKIIFRFHTTRHGSSLQLGQCVRGQNGLFTISNQLQEIVWIIRYKDAVNLIVDSASHSLFNRTGSN